MHVASRLRNFRELKEQIGLGSACQAMFGSACDLAARKFGSRFRRPAIQLELRGYDHPLFLRPGTSDLSAFLQIFTHRQYECLSYVKNPELIVDCGANVGYASAYLLNRYPTARVIAIEPDPENVEICRMNLFPYGTRARILAAAIWDHPARLAIRRNPAGREWSTQVAEASPDHSGVVRGMDMASIFDLGGGHDVDLLKIDIEGAELQIFGSDAAKWLRKVKNIAVELHSEESRQALFRALADFDYGNFCFGELTICRELKGRRPETDRTNQSPISS